MTNKNYHPIETITTKTTFLDYINSLDVPQIDYFAIGIQNTCTKRSMSIMSLPEWQQYFTDNHLVNHDPVRKVTLFTNRNIIPFEEIDFVDSYGKEIMKQRSLFGIKNGIILMQRHLKHNYMVTLGTGFSKFDSFNFIKRYHDKINVIKNELISIIEKDATMFNLSMHPSSGAK